MTRKVVAPIAIISLVLLALVEAPAAFATPQVVSASCRPSAAYGRYWHNYQIRVRSPNDRDIQSMQAIFIDQNNQTIRSNGNLAAEFSESHRLWNIFANLEPKGYRYYLVYTKADGSRVVDDNAGQLYELAPQCRDYLYGESKIAITQIVRNPYDESLIFEVLVKNLAYQKNVRLHISIDDWHSERVFDLQYSLSDTRRAANSAEPESEERFVENWNLAIAEQELLSEPVQFYISYEVNQNVYYDNNAGENYRLPTER